MFYIKLTSLNVFLLEEGPISPTGQFKQSLDSFYVTDSPLIVTNIAQMAIKLTSLNDFPLEEVPTGQSLDSFYVTHSPLRITIIAEMAMFYIKLTSLLIFP